MKVSPEKYKVSFTARILKFGKKGEKTGWTYIEIPFDVAEKLLPGNRKTFRVKGKLDDHAISKVAVLPMGNGGFILPLNLSMRKSIGKREGAMLNVRLGADDKKLPLNKILLDCLEDDKAASDFFESLAPSHRSYFSKYIDGAKTDRTKADRVAKILKALASRMSYAEMIRAGKH